MESNLNPPLCVDLDGTLLMGDSLFESLLSLIKRKPYLLFMALLWLTRGRAYFKNKIAQHCHLDASLIPHTQDFVHYLYAEHKNGRPLYLVTAADQHIAEKFAEHHGIFTDIIASDGKTNLKGKTKRDTLNEKFGKKQYDYAGNHHSDLAIWKDARKAIVVNANQYVVNQCRKITDIDRIYQAQKKSIKTFLRAIRVHQYVKNLLLFLPLLAGHSFDFVSLKNTFLAFIAFCLMASSAYLLNDLIDLEADRKHHTKRNRAFASGLLSIKWGLILSPLFFLSAILLSLFLPLQFLLILISYCFLTLAYSFYLKKLFLVDVFLLAGLYTLRILAGALALNMGVSEWLLSFSIFFFLSLAFLKRYSELYFAQQINKTEIHGRAYQLVDLNHISLFGAVSGYLSVLVLAFYLNSDQVVMLYQKPNLLWFICFFVLFWVTRIWLLAGRGAVHEDPIVFAIKDKVSIITVIVVFSIALFATF